MHQFCNGGRALPPGNDYGTLESGNVGSPDGGWQGRRQGLKCLIFSSALTQIWSHSLTVAFPIIPAAGSSLLWQWPWVIILPPASLPRPVTRLVTVSGPSEQHSKWVFSPPILRRRAPFPLLKGRVRGGVLHVAVF